jgi:hypothetical protein
MKDEMADARSEDPIVECDVGVPIVLPGGRYAGEYNHDITLLA